MAGMRWGAVVIRVVLAATFAAYGTMKLLGLQLATGDLSDVRFGEASPMLVTWHFFSLSPLYHTAIAAAQIVTGLLLLVPRTAAVGALCFLAIIVNIVLINFGYDVGADVKVFSSVLLALDGMLIGYYWPRYRLLLLPEARLRELLAASPGAATTGHERKP